MSHENAKSISIDEGRREALQALVSSLSANGATNSTRLGEDAVSALSERLNHILGEGSETGNGERRNEKGELLNEEGLPIIDIAEPYPEPSSSSKPRPSGASIQGKVPSLATPIGDEDEKARRRAEMDRIFDALEEEERRAQEREHQRNTPAPVPSVDEETRKRIQYEQKLAQRELQKKMGKALIQNVTKQREKEEQEAKAFGASPVNAGSSSNGQRTIKPKKSVTFSLPDDQEVKDSKPKSKPSMAWGDVSVGSLRSGLPKARIKSEELHRQPMKMEVVERIPGKTLALDPPEQDSDDESNPEVPEEPMDEDEDDENTPELDRDWDFDDSEGSEREHDEEDEFDFSEAAQQRAMALEYMRLKGSIGEDAYRAMTSHDHEGEDEWDQPEVPLEATLASKPSKAKPGISRWKAERQGTGDAASISLGSTVLPGHKVSHTLQRAIQPGKLEEGRLVGPADDSASEGEEAENVKKTLEMLKNGIVVDEGAVDVMPETESSSSIKQPISATPLRTPPTPSSSIRQPKPPSVLPSPQSRPHTQTQIRTTGQAAFTTPPITPDPSVLSTLIVDSPSFPRPSPQSRLDQGREGEGEERVQAVLNEVKESSSRRIIGAGAREVRERERGGGRGMSGVMNVNGETETRRPSRFMAERMGMGNDDFD